MKTRLVPFGEYIPLRPALGWLTHDQQGREAGPGARHRRRVLMHAGGGRRPDRPADLLRVDLPRPRPCGRQRRGADDRLRVGDVHVPGQLGAAAARDARRRTGGGDRPAGRAGRADRACRRRSTRAGAGSPGWTRRARIGRRDGPARAGRTPYDRFGDLVPGSPSPSHSARAFWAWRAALPTVTDPDTSTRADVGSGLVRVMWMRHNDRRGHPSIGTRGRWGRRTSQRSQEVRCPHVAFSTSTQRRLRCARTSSGPSQVYSACPRHCRGAISPRLRARCGPSLLGGTIPARPPASSPHCATGACCASR